MEESGYSPGTLSLDVTVLFLRASGVALSNTVGEVSWDDVSQGNELAWICVLPFGSPDDVVSRC